eukprot:4000426-Prymnesium_polylepis.1
MAVGARFRDRHRVPARVSCAEGVRMTRARSVCDERTALVPKKRRRSPKHASLAVSTASSAALALRATVEAAQLALSHDALLC